MKKTFAILICLFCSQSFASDVQIEWNKKTYEATVHDQDNVSLRELKEQLGLEVKDMTQPYIGALYVRDTSVIVDDDSICLIDENGSGGPFQVIFEGDVTLRFDSKISFYEKNAAFTVGDTQADPDHPVEANLTMNITANAFGTLDWRPEGDNLFAHRFLYCSYFGLQAGTVGATLAGKNKGEYIGDYEFVGYIRDAKDLEVGQVAIMALNFDTAGWQDDFEPWSGSSLALVARGVEQGGNVVAPDLVLPEPTTGTLSLLALAGLAARRRRK